MGQKKIKKDAPKEDLARMVASGFGSMEKRFVGLENSIDKKITDLKEDLGGKINGLSNRIDDLALNRAIREEIKILSLRVENIEQKVGIKK